MLFIAGIGITPAPIHAQVHETKLTALDGAKNGLFRNTVAIDDRRAIIVQVTVKSLHTPALLTYTSTEVEPGGK